MVPGGHHSRERVLVFCAASGTDLQHAGVTSATVTAMVVKGLIDRDTAGALALTDRDLARRSVLHQHRDLSSDNHR
jgi:hypothetical protein